MSKQIPPFGLRLPPDLKKKIKEAATSNCRSMNSEMIILIRKGLAAEEVVDA